MAITIHIYYSGTGNHARNFAQEMLSTGIVDRIRGEEGNLQYEYFFPFNDDSTVLLIDRWISQEALDAHHHSEMMQSIIALREKYDLHMKVQRYISDESGVPEKDKAYIKE